MAHAYVRLTGDRKHPTEDIRIEQVDARTFRVTVRGEETLVDGCLTPAGIALKIGGRSLDLPIEVRDGRRVVTLPDGSASHEILDARTWQMRAVLGGAGGAAKPELLSPMAGKVIMVRVAPGDTVEGGQALVIIEAMKMENELRATAPAVVKSVHVEAGAIVNPGDILLAFEVEPE